MAYRRASLYFVLIVSCLARAALASNPASKTLLVDKVVTLTVDSSINPGIYSFLESGYQRAAKLGAQLLLIRLDTPGGLISTTKSIITLIGDQNILTVVWVTPEGASATSAGAIIASAAHFLVMSPGTNMGAATPIQLNSDIKRPDARAKAINDLRALVQSLAESRGRNAEAFGRMIETAESFKAQEALESKLIDAIASTEEQVLAKLEGRVVRIKGQDYVVQSLPTTQWVEQQMDLGQKLLNILANPNLAYILFLVGAALLYVEFQAPGGFVAGAVGSLCIVLSGIGFQVLPLNFGALGLLILAFIMFVLEMYITSYGILSLAGLGALLAGSLFLFRTDEAYLSVSRNLIFTTVAVIAVFLLLLGVFLVRDIRKKKLPDNYYSLVGKTAKIVRVLPQDSQGCYHYQIMVTGEIWRARSLELYKEGDSCEVKKESTDEGLILQI